MSSLLTCTVTVSKGVMVMIRSDAMFVNDSNRNLHISAAVTSSYKFEITAGEKPQLKRKRMQ